MTKDIEILDDMLASLVELLVEKGIMTHEEYEERVKKVKRFRGINTI